MENGFRDLFEQASIRVKFLGDRDTYDFGFQKWAVALYAPSGQEAPANALNTKKAESVQASGAVCVHAQKSLTNGIPD